MTLLLSDVIQPRNALNGPRWKTVTATRQYSTWFCFIKYPLSLLSCEVIRQTTANFDSILLLKSNESGRTTVIYEVSKPFIEVNRVTKSQGFPPRNSEIKLNCMIYFSSNFFHIFPCELVDWSCGKRYFLNHNILNSRPVFWMIPGWINPCWFTALTMHYITFAI